MTDQAVKAGEELVTLPLPAKLAQTYREAPPQEKRKWELLVRFQLQALADRNRTRTIEEIMAELGSQAVTNGMTEEEFTSIMEESDDERGS